MRRLVVDGSLAISFFLFCLSPTLLSFPEDMVFVYLMVAVISTVPLALADKPSRRRIAWVMTVSAIVASSVCSYRGTKRLNELMERWKEQAITLRYGPSEPAS